MNSSSGKNFFSGERLRLIVLSVINNLSSPLSTLFISFLVVRIVSVDMWGQYARILLMITFLNQLSAWGNKEYLVREYSQIPAAIPAIWIDSFVSRSILLLPITVFVFFTSYDLLIQAGIIFIVLLRFLAQSYDSLLFYNRNYLLRISLEVVWGGLFAVLLFIFYEPLTLTQLIFITVSADLAKTLIIVIVLRVSFSFESGRTGSYFKKSLLFFLFGFTGFIISRTDQFSAALFLDAAEMGKYNVIMSFLLIIQSASNYVLQPFLKNIYRLQFTAVKKMALNFLLLGIVIGAAGVGLMYFIVLYFYHIEMDSSILLMGYLFVLPVYYYSAYIFNLFKINRLGSIISMNIAGAILTFLLSFILIKVNGESISMLLFSATLTQYVLLVVYRFYPFNIRLSKNHL